MKLLQTSLISGIAVSVRIFTAIFLNKIIAVYVGPAGFAVIGQFQSLLSMVTTFASGALNNGVIKLTAENGAAPAQQRAVWRTAATMGLVGSAACAGVLVVARNPISENLLGHTDYAGVLVAGGAALVLVATNGLMLAALNGLKAVKALAIANVIGSVIGAAVAAAFVIAYGVWGALLAVVISQAIPVVATGAVFRKATQTPLRALVGAIDPIIARQLGAFAVMAVTTAVSAPIGHIVIRDQIAGELGWEAAGLWQALWKISETHLLLLTSVLSVYFLPRFSEIRSGAALHREVVHGYRFIVPLVLLSALLLYTMREGLVRALLSPEFLPLTGLLGIQLIGDVLKICSWVVAFTMISHARTKAFVTTEISFTLIFVLTTVGLVKSIGLPGAPIAYAGTYAGYFAVVFYLYRGLVSRLDRAAWPGNPIHAGHEH